MPDNKNSKQSEIILGGQGSLKSDAQQPLRPVGDQQISDIASDFLAFGGQVQTRLPDIQEVRDNTMVIVEKEGYKFLYMAIAGTWVIIKSLQPTWDDLRFPASGGKLPASSSPTWTTWNTDFQLLGFDTGEYIFFFVQLPHRWKTGTKISPHLHIVAETAGAGAGAENMKWELTYTWANINNAYGAGVTINGGDVDLQDTQADRHFIYEFPFIEGEGKGLSSMLVCKLERVSTSNNYSDLIFLLEFDIHILQTEDGSEEEYEQVIIQE